MLPKLLIFDLDGTLIDSADDISVALNRMLTDLERPALQPAAVRSMVGDGAAKLVARALAATSHDDSEPDQQAAVDNFLSHYAIGAVTKTTLYPDVMKTLAALAAQNIPMAVCTNKPEIHALAILQHFDMAKFFQRVVGGDTFPWRKPDPKLLLDLCADFQVSHTHALLIGDSEVDAATAHAAGMRFVFMTYGYHRSSIDTIPCWSKLDVFSGLLSLF